MHKLGGGEPRTQKEKNKKSNNYEKTKDATAVVASSLGVLVADDVTGIGVLDDPAIPVVAVVGGAVIGGIAIYEYIDNNYQNIVNLFASEHSKNQRPSNWNKHTKPRAGRSSTKNRQNTKWKPNLNKKK